MSDVSDIDRYEQSSEIHGMDLEVMILTMGKSHGQMSLGHSPPQWLRCCLFCTSHDKTRTSGLHMILGWLISGRAVGETDDVRSKGACVLHQILFAPRLRISSPVSRHYWVPPSSFILRSSFPISKVTSRNRLGLASGPKPKTAGSGPKNPNAKRGAHHPPAAASALSKPSAPIVNFALSMPKRPHSFQARPLISSGPVMFNEARQRQPTATPFHPRNAPQPWEALTACTMLLLCILSRISAAPSQISKQARVQTRRHGAGWGAFGSLGDSWCGDAGNPLRAAPVCTEHVWVRWMDGMLVDGWEQPVG